MRMIQVTRGLKVQILSSNGSMKIPVFILTFECSQRIKNNPGLLRGYFGRKFNEYELIHHHTKEDKLIYKYPMIQYKVLEGKPTVLGIGLGADVLKNIYEDVNELQLGGKSFEIFGKTMVYAKAEYGISNILLLYSFHTPWLALNEKKYEKYIKFGAWTKKKELLEKIIIGNIISMSKGLGYTVPAPIKANIIKLKEVRTSLKGTPMLGFLGTFSVNFEIPDYWGIGKSVSRGFGTVKRVEELGS